MSFLVNPVFPSDIVKIYNKKMHQNVGKYVKRQVLELLSANVPLKKSQPYIGRSEAQPAAFQFESANTARFKPKRV